MAKRKGLQNAAVIPTREENRDEFNRRVHSYRSLDEEAAFSLNAALAAVNIKLHSVVHRVKETESFVNKCERHRVSKPFEQIEDIVGLRVICLFLSDIERIGAVIRETFVVIREDNKLDDSKLASFGYLSVHFIVKLGADYSGPRYNGLTDLLVEIQVRTIAMDAWANISHYLDYKQDQDIPKELKRDFYALSGMFYVADKHFQLFFEQREFEREKVVEEIRFTLDEQPINLDTLSAYLDERYKDRPGSDAESISYLVGELTKAGYTSIKELDSVVNSSRKAFLKYEKEHPPYSERGRKFAGVGVVRGSLDIADSTFLEIRDASSFQFRNEQLSEYQELLEDKRRIAPNSHNEKI